MKIADSRSAARYPDWETDPVTGYKDAVEPAEPGEIHAWLYTPDDVGPARWILNQRGTALLQDGHVEAACGLSLRVIYRMSFDMTQDNACPRCVRIARLWQTSRAEYYELIRERHERWAERDRRRYKALDANDLARQDSYGTDPIEDDDSGEPL
ncbi:hypothetical protein MMAN_16490 [Mycobacterium mantenii]|uniref:Uncharacterized protein n=1 Tax=Mycobacterium mantenii TaxID=560555 RepID=A0A1X0FDL4_MYCNT|nr:hypothetical protein [Mycobacterium mantenii]MCV7245888.1 hypothetical protein [Mycobacterium mantenii]ORA99830.1 hypothetical protein BST30_23680 [Mycobacterium mantenii]BBY37515.1 hypothetical protein MMAN_16490 [Mycobacterium mantenii]